jgi:predicted methyltransferase
MAFEKTQDKVRKDMLEKYNMYFIWENVIFEKIHDDLLNKNLLKENNYYNGYLPVTKKKLEKLIDYRNSAIKKEEMTFLDEVLGLLHLKEFKSTG